MTYVYLLLAFGPAEVPLLRIEQDKTSRHVTVSVTLNSKTIATLPAGAIARRRGEALLQLALNQKGQKQGSAIFGSYTRRGNRLLFVPRFPLVPGESYTATFNPNEGEPKTVQHVVPEHYTRDAPKVVAIYPSSARLAENHLKFYIYFSQPMREGREIFQHIRLLDSAGREVVGPWRMQELWNHDATRFTLWIHPGRIKAGLNLRKVEGAVLVAGQQYTLRIKPSTKGADGQTLDVEYQKVFRVMGPDKKRPAPASWGILVPKTETRQSLRILFQEPLDYALARRRLGVHDASGQLVPGDVTLEMNETKWVFAPKVPWRDELYRVVVDPELEDLAGNTPTRVFDTDLQKVGKQKLATELRFRPKGN